MAEVTRRHFALGMLKRLGLRRSYNRVTALCGWMAGENTTAKYNALADERDMPGATDYNAAGVKNYVDLAQGLTATIDTLDLPYYNNIRAALTANRQPMVTAALIAASPWGTHQAAINGTKWAILHPIAARRTLIGQ